MAVSASKKVVLVVLLAAAYIIGRGNEEHKKYDELKSKPLSELSQQDREFIKKTEDDRAKAESDRREYQLEEKRKKESSKAKPLSEQELLQNDVIFSCNEMARNALNYPDSFKIDHTKSGIDNQQGSKVYYYTLDYSGVNAFNVRSTHTIECYGTIGDESRKVTYRKFN